VTSGVIQVSATNSTDSGQKDSLTIAEEDLSSHTPGAKALHNETNTEESTRMIIEAQLVVEVDTEQLGQKKEREKIEEVTRQKLI
jgi:hypothetical protein